MEINEIDSIILSSAKNAIGIVDACVLKDEDRSEILLIEKDAEERSLMGLGKVINTGVIEVMKCNRIYAALTNMEFNWGNHPTMVLKKGEEIVGEEVRDKDIIERLSKQKNVWFMHKNFVIYKDKICFPQDIMKKNCYFEIPSIPADWCKFSSDQIECNPVIYANPATPTDVFLKEHYFRNIDEHGLGTILIGFSPL